MHSLAPAGDTPRLNLPESARKNSKDALRHQEQLAILRERLLQQLYSGTYDGGHNLPASLPRNPIAQAEALGHISLDDLIRVMPGGCLEGIPEWAEGSEAGILQVSNFSYLVLNDIDLNG